ncbi:MAG: efflux RND transporter periplasmic adaptor subunit, partial [Gammaproteobacteria bacterium]
AIYTINEEKVVVRDLVEILYFEGEYAYVNGTLNDGDLIVLGGAQKIIEGKSLNIQ